MPPRRSSLEAPGDVTIAPSAGPLVVLTFALVHSQRMGSASGWEGLGYCWEVGVGPPLSQGPMGCLSIFLGLGLLPS